MLNIPLKVLFELPTIRGLANEIQVRILDDKGFIDDPAAS